MQITYIYKYSKIITEKLLLAKHQDKWDQPEVRIQQMLQGMKI